MTGWINGIFTRRRRPALPWGQFDLTGEERSIVLHDDDLDENGNPARQCTGHTHDSAPDLPRRQPRLSPATDDEVRFWRRVGWPVNGQ